MDIKRILLCSLSSMVFIFFPHHLAGAAGPATETKARQIMKYICKGDFDNFYINSRQIQREISLIESLYPKALWTEKKHELYINAKAIAYSGNFSEHIAHHSTLKAYYEIRTHVSSSDCSNMELNDTKKFGSEIAIYYFIIDGNIIAIWMEDGLFSTGRIERIKKDE